jgi:hypothetical protein
MSFRNNYDSNIQNILDDTIQRFFTEIDSSFNYLNEFVSIPTFETNIPLYRQEDQEYDTNYTDSIPNINTRNPEPMSNTPTNVNHIPDRNEGIQLWANVLEDYHSQMRMYQENIRNILDITQTFLPQTRNIPRTQRQNATDISFLRNLFRNNIYSIEIERLFPSLFSINIPTSTQIQNETREIIYDLSNNQLSYQICPISLEEFSDGESLTQIIQCGHIFKTFELSRWFRRNSHCPTCRYDIQHN